MERYVRQLIEDIQYAKANVPEPWWSFVDNDESSFAWTEDPGTAPRKSLEEWTGLKKIQLPPATYLSGQQVHLLLSALKDMLGEYNCHVVFQISVPEELQYEIVRKRFDQQSPLLKANMHFFEFCDPSQDKGNCQLGDFCHCRFFDNLLANYEEDGIDFETGHNLLYEEEHSFLDAQESENPLFDDLLDNEFDDTEGFDWDDEEEDDDWNWH